MRDKIQYLMVLIQKERILEKQVICLTLDYDETVYLTQPFGTRSESVTPFILNFWQGSIDLIPASDTWVDTVRLEPKIIQREGNFAETVAEAERSFGGFDPQTGLTDTIWGGWQTVWTGTETQIHTRKTISWVDGMVEELNSKIQQEETFRTGQDTRQGTRQLITENLIKFLMVIEPYQVKSYQ